jgi:TetR/AcrR family transcriptional regulator
MARRSNDPARTREKILLRATEEFAARGFDGGRVDQIARRCGLSKNMLYYYFHSKEKLFIAVLERMYESLREAQRELALRTSDPFVAMEQLIRHTFNALESNPTAIRLMNEENKHRGKYLRKSQRLRDLYNPLVETIGFILERGRKQALFRAGLDPAIVYLTFSSMCYHYLSNRYTLQIALDRDLTATSAREAWLKHVTHVVLQHCAADPKLERRQASAARGRRLNVSYAA